MSDNSFNLGYTTLSSGFIPNLIISRGIYYVPRKWETELQIFNPEELSNIFTILQHISHIYVPTMSANKEEIEKFYWDIFCRYPLPSHIPKVMAKSQYFLLVKCQIVWEYDNFLFFWSDWKFPDDYLLF